MPLIVACTSDIIDDHLIGEIENAGFDGVYEAPIKDEMIKNEIIAKLKDREV
jgi:hypothetical protein